MDTSVDQLRTRAVALVADWVATLFRPYASAADLDRLVESVLAALTAAVSDADARLEGALAAVGQAARALHEPAHEGPFDACQRPPCPAFRDAIARAAQTA